MRLWPPALIYRAAEIEQERDAARRLVELQDIAIGSGLKLGQKYVDPGKPAGDLDTSEPHYSLKPLSEHQEALERVARPWLHTQEAIIRRREEEEEAMFDAMFNLTAARA